MLNELEKMIEEAVVAYLKALSHSIRPDVQEYHVKRHSV
jgi:hypothetical protein